jgi:superfamily II DNA or RNA helicase
MRIYVTPTFAYVQGRIPVQIVEALVACTRARRRGYQHMKLFKLHRWDGWDSFLHKQPDGTYVFPAGLTHHVLHACATHYIPYELSHEVPLVTPLRTGTPLPDGTELYGDQGECLELAIRHQRGLFDLATNFGKLELAAGIFTAFQDYRCVYVVRGRNAFDEAWPRLEERLRLRVGKIAAGRLFLNERVTVVSFDTLRSKWDQPAVRAFLEAQQALIVDEVHDVTQHSWFPVLGACKAPVRIGMSGSLKEAHSRVIMEAFFGPVLKTVTDAPLVASGRSAKPIILMPYAGNMVQSVRGAAFDDTYLPGIVRNVQRNTILVDFIERMARRELPTLVWFYRLEHGHVLTAMLRARGVTAECLHGGSPPYVVHQAKEAVSSGRLQVLVGSTTFNKALNLPALEGFGNAAGWKSAQATVQKRGRALRQKQGRPNRFVLVDPFDLGSSVLRRHSEARERTYRRRGDEVHKGAPADLLGLVQ